MNLTRWGRGIAAGIGALLAVTQPISAHHSFAAELRVTQRYTRTDLGHIAFEMTIDDPKTYTKPWKNTRTFTLRPDWEMMEYSCEENNKSLWEGRIKAPKY